MAKLDVNKIIEESLTEANMNFGEKIYDKLHPEDPNSPKEQAFRAAQRFQRAASRGDVEGTKKALRTMKQSLPDKGEEDLLRQETIRDAQRPPRNALVYGSDEYKKIIDQQEKAANVAEKATTAGKKIVGQAQDGDTASAINNVAKSAGNVDEDVQSSVKDFGGKVANYLTNLDYGKTALAAGLIGTGALALRKRQSKK